MQTQTDCLNLFEKVKLVCLKMYFFGWVRSQTTDNKLLWVEVSEVENMKVKSVSHLGLASLCSSLRAALLSRNANNLRFKSNLKLSSACFPSSLLHVNLWICQNHPGASLPQQGTWFRPRCARSPCHQKLPSGNETAWACRFLWWARLSELQKKHTTPVSSSHAEGGLVLR